MTKTEPRAPEAETENRPPTKGGYATVIFASFRRDTNVAWRLYGYGFAVPAAASMPPGHSRE